MNRDIILFRSRKNRVVRSIDEYFYSGKLSVIKQIAWSTDEYFY